MHINLQMIVLFVMAVVSCVLGVSIVRGKLRGPGSKAVGFLMFAGSAWLLAFALEIGSPSYKGKVFWDAVNHFVCILLPVAWLVFVLQFSGRGHLVTKWNLVLLGIVPLVFSLLILTNQAHELLWNSHEINENNLFLELNKTYGLFYWVLLAYSFIQIFVGAFLALQMLIYSIEVYKYQASAVLAASLVPVIGILLIAFDIGPFTSSDIGPIVTVITTWVVVWTVVRFPLIDTMRKARDTVLERMSHGVIVLYAGNEIVYLNSVAERLLDCEADKVIGSTLEQHWKEWPGGCEGTEGNAEINVEITVDREGVERTHELSMSPLLDWKGRFIGQVVLTKDITERIQSEADLRRYAEKLERSNQELERFAYIASHDLQEPLRSISSYTQLLANRYKGKLDEDADDFIFYIVNGVARMQQLIDDLLEYSRVETHGKAFRETDTTQLLERVLNALEISIQESGAKVSHNGMPTINADSTQLAQLFQNLIGNALKFRSTRPLEIEIKTEQEGDSWHFVVSDNGIGIEEKYFDRIFQIFQRLHSLEEYPGTGIGLAICKRIVDRHGGRIWVESIPGVGSSFHFTLPEKGNLYT
jgi:PAS domain S-box-containing protein